MLNMNKSQNSLINYKIVRCKNWEQDKTCKYGAHCTFAHGDNELRNKADNIYQFNPNMQFMYPMIMPAGMDFNQMQKMMANGQLIKKLFYFQIIYKVHHFMLGISFYTLKMD